jgi:dipeptidyl aminopeptidase/acylaminoacyl peptidase
LYKRIFDEKLEDKSLLEYYSMEQQVSKTKPPTYIIYGLGDNSVPYQNHEIHLDKLNENNITYRSLRLKNGVHGFG